MDRVFVEILIIIIIVIIIIVIIIITKKDSMRYTKLQKDVCHNLWLAQTALIRYTQEDRLND